MSVSSETTTTENPSADALAATIGVRAAAIWQQIERVLTRLGDYLNPILVKETRQAIKSSQFTITFVLVLVACWVVTIGGVAWFGPGIFYSAAGGAMLFAYYVILAFPLLVMIPIAAYRSLSAEREDNTYDLLSITTLKPRQIISGKLGSAMVQMGVYFSAITPCLAFTYLLRGVDVPTIVLLLLYTFLMSLALAMIGLLLATLSRQRMGQVFLLVVFISALLYLFGTSLAGAYQLISFSNSWLGDESFWSGNLCMLTLYATSFALAFFAAAGMITFASENRSTPLRICMLLQQAAFVGWFGFLWLGLVPTQFDIMAILAMAIMAGLYWYAMGTLLTAERPETSQRIQRRLPSSTLARVFLTWLNPGPASGYMFVVANASAIVVISLLGIAVSEFAGRGGGRWLGTDELIYLLVIGWGYIVAYLGLGLIVVTALRKIALVTMLGCVLIHFLLVLAGSGIPMAFQMMSVELRYVDYSYLQIANPFWSLIHLANGGMATEGNVLVIVVPAAALCMLLLNLPAVVREVQRVRISPPTRVVEDEAALHPLPQDRPKSPWDR
ncbi:MAG: ABC transporter permease [Pirellulales bacterium]